MGSGATKQAREKSEEQAGTPAPQRRDSFQQEQDDENINPEEYITQYQSVVHSGIVWKLNYGENPELAAAWLKRKMWLTDTGGLFYFSLQHGALRGCSIAGLTFVVPEKQPLGRFAIEAAAVSADALGPDQSKTKTQPTVLATATEKERDEWFASVQSVQQNATAVERDSLDPLEPFVGPGVHNSRKRMCCKNTPQRKQTRSRTTATNYTTASYVSTESQKKPRPHFKSSRSADMCPPTPRSVGPSVFQSAKPIKIRRDSQCNFASKFHTALVFDWDDTIFPTTFIREDCELDHRKSIDEQLEPGPATDDLKQRLESLSKEIETFLNLACSMAQVFIVTLARRPWVDNSSTLFMPGIRRCLDENAIKVFYAREHITAAAKEAYYADAFKTAEDENEFWMRAKAAAMQQQFESMHSKVDMSWKNLISVGDSDCERLALKQVAEDYVVAQSKDASVSEVGMTNELICKNGHRMRVRAKTVKMLAEPSCEEMLAQIRLLNTWLSHIVSRDSGLEVELTDPTDDNLLREVHQHVTGLISEDLSWPVLGGLTEAAPFSSEISPSVAYQSQQSIPEDPDDPPGLWGG